MLVVSYQSLLVLLVWSDPDKAHPPLRCCLNAFSSNPEGSLFPIMTIIVTPPGSQSIIHILLVFIRYWWVQVQRLELMMKHELMHAQKLISGDWDEVIK